MPLLLAFTMSSALCWYAIPLIVVISLVYGGTRHEQLPQILHQAWHSAIWIVVFMAIIFAIVWLAGYGVT